MRHFRPQLVAQHIGRNFCNLAALQIPELERAERQADEAVYLQTQMLKNAFDLAVFAFSEAKREPAIVALGLVEPRLDWPVLDAIDLNPGLQPIELFLINGSKRPYPVTAQPAGFGQLDGARQFSVIGEQQQAFGIDVEPAD